MTPAIHQSITAGDGWELRQGDCLEGMRLLADKSVDVVITDPPYDQHTHKNGKRGRWGAQRFTNRGHAPSREQTRGAFSRNRDLGFDAITTEQMASTAAEFARVSKRWSLVFCAVEMISDWRTAVEAAGLEYVRTCFWHKLGSTPQFTGDRPAIAVEAIVCAHPRGRKRWNGGGKHGWYDVADLPQLVYEHAIVLERGHGEVRLHTTQKPIALLRELVTDFSDPGELVMDAYAGSATTAMACSQLGRRSIGFELSPDYYDIACRRLRGDEARPNPAQPSLF